MTLAHKNVIVNQEGVIPPGRAAEPPRAWERCSFSVLILGLLKWNLLEAAWESTCFQTSLGDRQAELPGDTFTFPCAQGRGTLQTVFIGADYSYGLLPFGC